MKRGVGLLLFLFLLVGDTAGLRAGEAVSDEPSPTQVDVTLQIEGADEALVGQTLSAILTLTYPSHFEVHFPKRPALGKHFHLTGHNKAVHVKDDGLIQETHTLQFHILRTGRQRFRAMDIPYVDADKADAVSSPAKIVIVKSRLANEIAPALKPSTEPLVIHQRNDPLIWSLAFFGVIFSTALVTLLAARALRSRFGHRPPETPPRPAHDIAYQRLEALKQGSHLEQGDIKGYCFELTEITREYFTNRYTIHALGETTTELLEKLDEMQPEDLDLDIVSAVFQEADLIKFAKMPANEDALRDALGLVWAIVESTRQQPTEEEEDVPEIFPAEPHRRAAGWMLDLAIAHVCLVLPAVMMAHFSERYLHPLAIQALIIAFVLLRDILPGGSFGKGWLHLRIVLSENPKSNAVPIPLRVIRNLILAIPVVGIVAAWVWMRRDVDGCRPGDRLAGTMVVDDRPETGMGRSLAQILAGLAIILGVLFLGPLSLGLEPLTFWMGG